MTTATHPNAQSIRDFYTAFGQRDAEGMIAVYAPDVAFSDPVFTALTGDEVFAMWRMLCGRAEDLSIEASDIEADDESGRAYWQARYTFSKTGRMVHNRIQARFQFRDGKIVRHDDSFDLWAWAGMALGLKGRLLGWTPLVRGAIRRQADASLREFMRRAEPT